MSELLPISRVVIYNDREKPWPSSPRDSDPRLDQGANGLSLASGFDLF